MIYRSILVTFLLSRSWQIFSFHHETKKTLFQWSKWDCWCFVVRTNSRKSLSSHNMKIFMYTTRKSMNIYKNISICHPWLTHYWLQFFSSLPSLQSGSPSHFHSMLIQSPLLHLKSVDWSHAAEQFIEWT